jgi:hypothetical protein
LIDGKEGLPPENEFKYTLKFSIPPKCDIVPAMVPVRLFTYRCISVRLAKELISAGKDPVKRFERRERPVSCTSAPISEGMVPVISFSARLRYFRLVRL